MLKAWEQVETKRDEVIAYQFFDGRRLARKRNGQIRTHKPDKMPLFLTTGWTKSCVLNHVEQMVDTSEMCSISRADIDSFLKGGILPGTTRSRNSQELAASLEHLTDKARRRRKGMNRRQDILGHPWYVEDRREASIKVAKDFRYFHGRILAGQIRYHIIGSRRGTLGMHRQMVHVLWRRIADREIALATLRAYGRECTVADYNRVAASWHISCGPDGSRDRGISSLRETHRAAFVFHRELNLTKTADIAGAIQNLPLRLREITGSSQLWRATMEWSDPQIIPIARILRRMTDTRDRMPIDTELGCSLLSRIVGRGHWPALVLQSLSWLNENELRVLLPFLPALHAAVIEARRKRRLKAFLSSIGLVVDMLRNLDDDAYATLEHDARNASWARLDERQAEWHRVMAEVRRQELEAEIATQHDWEPDASWQPVLGAHSDKNGDAIEIVDAKGLLQEALDLTHCVDSYVPDCVSGHSRIFSLRSGEHRSTLELRRRYGVWQIMQNYADENSIPPKILNTLGRAVAAAANRAERQRPSA